MRGAPRIDDEVEIGVDALIEDGVCLRGQTRVGARTVVDAGSVITDFTIGEGALIKPYTVISPEQRG